MRKPGASGWGALMWDPDMGVSCGLGAALRPGPARLDGAGGIVGGSLISLPPRLHLVPYFACAVFVVSMAAGVPVVSGRLGMCGQGLATRPGPRLSGCPWGPALGLRWVPGVNGHHGVRGGCGWGCVGRDEGEWAEQLLGVLAGCRRLGSRAARCRQGLGESRHRGPVLGSWHPLDSRRGCLGLGAYPQGQPSQPQVQGGPDQASSTFP